MTGKKSHILGIDIDSITTSEFLARIEEFIAQRSPHQIAYVNAHSINKSFSDRSYRTILQGADLVYADGMGVVLASRLVGSGLPERVNAGDFVDAFCNLCVRKNYRLYFLGGDPGVAESAADNLRARHPGLHIVGTHHGYFTDAESPAIVQDIRDKAPDVLLVGMGQPIQEKWIRRNLERLNVPVAWGVGALFSYIAGTVSRAPEWMREWGLEWFHRLCVEPRRLWKRYLLGNFVFAFRAMLLVLADAMLGAAAWCFSYYAWVQFPLPFKKNIPNEFAHYLDALWVMIPAWIVVNASNGLYRRHRDLTHLEDLKNILRASLFFLGAAAAVAFLFKEWDLSRYVIVLSSVMNTALLIGSRMTFRHFEARMLRSGIGRVRTLIVGTSGMGIKVKERIEDHPHLEHYIVGFVDTMGRTSGPVDGHQILGSVEELSKLVVKHQVDEVFVAAPELEHKRVLNLVASCPREQVRFKVVTDMFGVITGEAHVDEIDDIPIIDLGSGRFGIFQRLAKRAMDLAVVLLVSPFAIVAAALIALAIRLSSKGPILFAHERVGKDGKVFKMYKFRTMHPEVEPYSEAPTGYDDPRIAGSIGRKLRRYSLDELPQLWNVFVGDMSLVGPRPEMPFIVDQYEDWQRRRLNVKPGITGLWQVIGRKDLPLHENLEYDFYYIQNQSLGLDLSILIKTVPVVIAGYGAY